MTAPSTYRYLYRVTASTQPTIAVDSLLIARGRLLRRDWTFLNRDDGTVTEVTGTRLNRLCSTCHARYRRGTEYGHPGECAPGVPPVIPSDGRGQG